MNRAKQMLYKKGYKTVKRGKRAKQMTMAEDKAWDRKHGIKEGSKEDIALDRARGIKEKGRKMKKRKNWIAGAIKHPGALRRTLGAKPGKPIPGKKLAAAEKKGGKTGARARLARTLRGFKHKKCMKKHKHGPNC